MSSRSTSRDASRRLAARGLDLESEARLLVERHRAGEFLKGELDLAAWAGDPAARIALDAPPPCWGEADRFAEGLGARGGRAAVARFGVALVKALQGSPPESRDWWAYERAESLDLEAAVLCPCYDHAIGWGGPDRSLDAPLGPDPSPDVVSACGAVFVGSEGLARTLTLVSGRRTGRLAASLTLAASQLCEWILYSRDPLRSGWATPTARIAGKSLEAALREALSTEGASALDLAIGLLDPAWASRVAQLAAGEYAGGPKLGELPGGEPWESHQTFEIRDDPGGLWRGLMALATRNGTTEARLRSHYLGYPEPPLPANFDFSF